MKKITAKTGQDPSDEMVALVQTLGQTEQRLQELMAGEVDAVLLPGGQPYFSSETHEQLRQSEERFRNLFIAAATGIAISTPQGRYLHANAAYCQMLGYTEAELLELNFAELTHPDDLNLNLEMRDDMLAGRRQGFVMEKRYLKKNGEIVWTRHSVSATHTAGGEIDTLMVVAEDITERKLAEQQLQWKTAFFEAQVHSSFDGILIVDHERKTILQNQRLDDLWEIPEAFALGGENPQRLDLVIRQVKNPSAFREKVAWLYDHPDEISRDEIELINGKFLDRYSAPVRGEDGRHYGRIWAFRDITERKRAEAALRNSEERLRLITNLVPHGIFAKDSAGRHIFANSALAELAGLPVEDIIGKDDFELVTNRAEAEAYRADDLAVIQSGKKKVIAEEPRTDLSGHTRFLQTIKIPFTVAETGEPAVLGVCMDITDRKQAEEELALFRTLVNRSPDSIEVIDPETGRFLDVNATGCARLGYSREELLSLTVADIDIEKDYRSLWPVVVEEVKRAGFGTIIGRHRRKDGSTFPVEVNARYVNLNRGYMVAVVRDITERKQAEEALARQRTELQVLFDLMPAMVWFKNTQNHVLRVNQRAAEATGRTVAEIEGQSMDDLYPQTAAKYYADDLEVIRSRVPKLEIVETLPAANGKELWVQTDKVPVFDREGKVTGIVVMVQDITERKRNEGRFRLLVDSNIQGVFFWNKDGRVTGSNDAFLRLVGHTREDLVAGRISWMTLTPPECVELDRRALEEIAASGTCAPYEKEFVLRDGSRVPVLIGAAVFQDNPVEGVAFVLDQTERKKLEKQFLRAQRMESIGTLAGGVAHDLNNILSPIMMSIALLQRTTDSPQSSEILKTIEVSAKRGADIVRQVLSFARGVEGERIEIQPGHLLKDLEHIIKDTFPKDIRLQFSVPADTWTILCDPTQVHQVLLNLCVNARDAMPNGGGLTVDVANCEFDEQYAVMNLQAKPGRYVNISVTDSGMGIPPAILDKIFEPFFTTKELNKGTGLGLSTVQAIVKSHGGIVNVYSEPGKGTTFKVYLPAVENSSGGQSPTQKITLPRGNGETILLVDDEASILTITGQTLQAFGYRVLTATNGAEAVALYAQHRQEIAVVLTDMMMPFMDGPTTIYAMLKINPDIKIVAASGLAATGGTTKAPAPSVKHFLTKPYTAEALLEVLRQILTEMKPT
jgi:PAS domain S-box-containing protein